MRYGNGRRLTETLQREAMRILEALTDGLHVRELRDREVLLEGLVPVAVFDRLCIWGAAAEDLEDEPAEDDHDAEEDD